MTEGGSSKFWEVDVRGHTLVVRFGRLGTDGQIKEKALASPAAATKEAERLVREKTGKGYVEKAAKKRTAGDKKVEPAASVLPVAKTWTRIERWFARHHPELDLKLRGPATPKAIAAAEKALDVRFADDFRTSLMVHDGQDDHASVWWLPVAQRLGSLDSIVRCWKDDRAGFDRKFLAEEPVFDRSGRVRQVHLHPRQIPFAGSPFWDYDRLLFDFAPGPKGTVGQVIARSDIDFKFVARSFTEFLALAAKELESGATTVFAD